ncbi:MAG: TraB/GumN family protein [Planctomycetes bacterium]|nr:TraB/GumN family protein [Planctomycetota bacterium]
MPNGRHLVRGLARAVSILLVSCAAAAAPGQEPSPTALANPRPFLWRVEGDVPSFLFGTIHLPDERATDVHPEVETVLGAADAVFTELAMDQIVSPKLMAAMQIPDGKTLGDIAPPALVERVRKKLGLPDATRASSLKLRPFALSLQVVLQGRAGKGVALDMQIYKDAKSAGKQVGGIETIEEQLAAFDSLDIAGEVGLLTVSLDVLDDFERRGLDLCTEMLDAYCAGDTKRLLSFFDLMGGEGSPWEALSRSLLTDRNLRMAERIDRMLHEAPKRRFVFAVGAGHLVGATSVVDILRARGHVVTRVPESLANIDEEVEQLKGEVEQREARIRLLQDRRRALAEPTRRKAG